MDTLRTNVTFKTRKFTISDISNSAPAALPFDQPFGGDAAIWLIEQLAALGFDADMKPCQEDWGWVVFVSRESKRFWIGVSPIFAGEDPPAWVIHIHHWHFSVLQRFTTGGRRALAELADAVNQLLQSSAEFTDIQWYFQQDLRQNHTESWADGPHG